MSSSEIFLLFGIAAITLVMAIFSSIENVGLRRRIDRLQAPIYQAGTARYPLSVIDHYRNSIAKSFPAHFVAQFEPADFQRLVEERLRTALMHAQPSITGDGRPEMME